MKVLLNSSEINCKNFWTDLKKNPLKNSENVPRKKLKLKMRKSTIKRYMEKGWSFDSDEKRENYMHSTLEIPTWTEEEVN